MSKHSYSDILHQEETPYQPGVDVNLIPIAYADIPDKARAQLQERLDRKYINTISQTTRDIGRTNLIELDIPTEGPPITSKPCSVPLKYCEFLDHEIEQLVKAGIIPWSMSDRASPIMVVPKKEECADISISNT